MMTSCNREKKAPVNHGNVNKSITNNGSNILYEIQKIDSTQHLYLIYAKKSDKYYKIFSDKETERIDCNKIKLNEKYKFELDTVLSQTGVYEHMSGLRLNDKSTVHFEGDSIRDLYVSKNIKGLCYYPNE
ncbi:hypothetical protein [uncultured Psychroserpens sp.]|nr:hypothetical protein [uncultured Psychroserpens sp.]